MKTCDPLAATAVIVLGFGAVLAQDVSFRVGSRSHWWWVMSRMERHSSTRLSSAIRIWLRDGWSVVLSECFWANPM